MNINLSINIEPIKQEELEECASRLFESDFGKIYYPTYTTILSILTEAYKKDYIFIAKNNEKKLGFIWFSEDGVFKKFPYLNMLFVFPEFRHNGIAKSLIKYFENMMCKTKKNPKIKIFLLVKSGNDIALKMYISMGYKKLYTFENLFKRRVDEILMFKEIITLK